jgi:uncharacterized pyridoxamine 5'-phosphate oxidase family protein
MSNLIQSIDYINNTRYAVLATIGDKSPGVRTLGSVTNDGTTIYFSTATATQKVKDITENKNVTILFEQEAQDIKTFYSVTIYGEASVLSKGATQYNKAVELLSVKNPKFKERVKDTQLEGTTLYKVDSTQFKILDFSKGAGPLSIEVIDVA